jgi:hypothetical protein
LAQNSPAARLGFNPYTILTPPTRCSIERPVPPRGCGAHARPRPNPSPARVRRGMAYRTAAQRWGTLASSHACTRPRARRTAHPPGSRGCARCFRRCESWRLVTVPAVARAGQSPASSQHPSCAATASSGWRFPRSSSASLWPPVQPGWPLVRPQARGGVRGPQPCLRHARPRPDRPA